MNVKIAVVYHGEPKLCSTVIDRSDIFVPIMAGSIWNKKKFDFPNMLYDNVGDNISWLNPYINEITAIYWVGRHLDMLGNPDYVGINHYRRLFDPNDVVKHLNPDTLLVNEEEIMLPTVDFLDMCHGLGPYVVELSDKIIDKNDAAMQKLFFEFLVSKVYFGRNLFVVPKNVMINLADNIQNLLMTVAKDICFDMYGTPAARSIGFIMERMVGFYFLTLVRRNGYKARPTTYYYLEEEDFL